MPITKDATRQAECLRQIAKYKKDWGESPSLSELGTKMGIDRVSVHLLVKKLKADGLLITVPGAQRNLRLTAAGEAVARGAVDGFHDREALKQRHEP